VVTVDWDSDTPKLARVVKFEFIVESYLLFIKSFLGHDSQSPLRKGFESFY